VLETALEKAGIARRHLNVPMELDSTEAILSSVEAGLIFSNGGTRREKLYGKQPDLTID